MDFVENSSTCFNQTGEFETMVFTNPILYWITGIGVLGVMVLISVTFYFSWRICKKRRQRERLIISNYAITNVNFRTTSNVYRNSTVIRSIPFSAVENGGILTKHSTTNQRPDDCNENCEIGSERVEVLENILNSNSV